MSSAALTLPRPARTAAPASPRADLSDQVILGFTAAEDVRSGVARTVALLRRAGAGRVEWWRPAESDGSLRLEIADGRGSGRRAAFALGPAGALVVVADRNLPELEFAVRRLSPILRRRYTEEQLAGRAAELARRNHGLEEFAALLAHELKGPLQAALLHGDASAEVEKALDLVDSVLEVARSQAATEGSASAAECLREALHDLGPIGAEVVAELPHEVRLPPAALRLILRNLVANAVAAGATHIRVVSAASWLIAVDDDGVGIEEPSGYATGNGIGFGLCCRLAARLGGLLELEPLPAGGTRATLMLERNRA